MTDAERIENIKTKAKVLVTLADNVGTGEANLLTIVNDINWLIEQAGKLDAFAAFADARVNQLVEENERLRKVLKAIKLRTQYAPVDKQIALNSVYGLAYRALEQSK